jgi:hypothetical protein
MAENIITKKTEQIIRKENYPILQVDELTKCIESPSYFINTYVKVHDSIDGFIPLELHPLQEHLIQEFINYKRNIVCGSRRVGLTKATAAFVLHQLLFTRNADIAIFSNTSTASKEIISIIRDMYKNLSHKFGVSLKINNKMSMEFDNGNRVIAEAATDCALRGRSPSLVICENFSLIPEHQQAEFWGSISPCLSMNCNIIIASVPNKRGDVFSQIWATANSISEENKFNPISIPWYSVPDRTTEFKKRCIETMGEDSWKSQYECKFM